MRRLACLVVVVCSPTTVVGTLESDAAGDESSSITDGDSCLVETMGCAACLADACCAEYFLCTETAGCACMLECLEDLSAEVCATQCAPGDVYGALIGCGFSACTDVCGA